MNRRKMTALIAVLICSLLLPGSAALAQSGGPPGYIGGHYRLTTVTWQVRRTASGGGYRLAAPVSPTGTGTPCCCTYLPCILQNY